ncbi:MAG: DUF2306 domain-containing protein [Phyllobacteriaceae bacterium]|nr:DUF2306 domain-containing protein [Phyllobacteriaceae bacterium]
MDDLPINLAPLLEAGPAVQIHALSAIGAVVVGAVVFGRRKGTKMHRLLGRIWVVLMLVTALSSFLISEFPMFLGFGPIHILSVVTLAGLYRAIKAARAGHIEAHNRGMVMLYFQALFLAGAFTFLPGRRMHAMFLAELSPFGMVVAGLCAVTLISGLAWLLIANYPRGKRAS